MKVFDAFSMFLGQHDLPFFFLTSILGSVTEKVIEVHRE